MVYTYVSNTYMNPLYVDKSLHVRKMTFGAMLDEILNNCCVIGPRPLSIRKTILEAAQKTAISAAGPASTLKK